MPHTKESNTNRKNTNIFIKSYEIAKRNKQTIINMKKSVESNETQILQKDDCIENNEWFRIQLNIDDNTTNNTYIIQEIRQQHKSNTKLMKALNNKKLDIYIYIKPFSDNVFFCVKNNKHHVVIKEEDINNVSHVKELLLSVVLSRGCQYINKRITDDPLGIYKKYKVTEGCKSPVINDNDNDNDNENEITLAGYHANDITLVGYHANDITLVGYHANDITLVGYHANDITSSNTENMESTKDNNENNLINILGSIPSINVEKRVLSKTNSHDTNIKYLIRFASEILNGDTKQKKSDKNHKQLKKPDRITDIKFDKGRVPDFIESLKLDNKIFFVTSYSGIDMYEYIVRHLKPNNVMCIKESACKSIFFQLFRILDELHTLGIAHGDMSLENTCLDITNCKLECVHNHKIPHVRLIDFGFSIIHPLSPLFEMLEGRQQSTRIVMHNTFNKSINSLECGVTDADYFYGKIDYFSPERLRAHYATCFIYDAYKDDVYALGIMLFRTLFGVSPYNNIKDHNVLERIISQESWLLNNIDFYNLIKKNISEDCLNLLRRILKPQSERITLKDILRHNWFK
jgi:serine/threonine protein kinase